MDGLTPLRNEIADVHPTTHHLIHWAINCP